MYHIAAVAAAPDLQPALRPADFKLGVLGRRNLGGPFSKALCAMNVGVDGQLGGQQRRAAFDLALFRLSLGSSFDCLVIVAQDPLNQFGDLAGLRARHIAFEPAPGRPRVAPVPATDIQKDRLVRSETNDGGNNRRTVA